jgi:hypothetical protein
MEPTTIAAIGKLIGAWMNSRGDDVGELDKLADGINRSLSTVTKIIVDYVYDASSGPTGAIQGAESNIIAQILDSAYKTDAAAVNNTRTITDLFEYGLHRVNDASAARDANLKGVIDFSAGAILDKLGRSVADILTPMNRQGTEILDVINGNRTVIDFGFEKVEELLREVLDGVNRKIENIINNEIIIGGDVFDVIMGKVRDVLGDQANVHLETVKVFDNVINTAIDGGMKQLAVVEMDQGAQQKRMADALDMMATRRSIFDGEGPTGPAGDYAIGVTIDTIKGWFSDPEGDLKEAKEKLLEAVAGSNWSSLMDDDCLLPLLKRDGSTGFAGWIAMILTTAMSWGILPFQMATVQANRQLQGFRTCFPDQLLSPPQMREMFHILGYERRELVELFQRQGYSKDDANIIMQTWETPPDLTMLFSMYWRKEIGEAELRSELRKHGYRPDMIKSIIDISVYIPPVQDLITMSVRDVFDANTVRLNRQNEDYPPEFTQWMAAQGVTKDWAEKYWQAHWRLPSETMGFEMYHRSIINKEELKGLMKSLDIMPGWRDRLIELSYNPLTRVDVRRMHSVGVLSEQEVTRAYLDIGYSPENAQRLTDFTVELNREEGLLTGDVASDLTKGQILSFYTDHIINREVAAALLAQAGVNVVAIELLLKSADFDIERKERKQIADIIFTGYKSGRYTFEAALTEIQNSGFNAREVEALTLDLELEQSKEFKLPARADLDRFLKKGVITREEYIETMVAQGYTPYWAERYAEAV